ncbi:hypothetical protein ACTXT7_015931 [Hymenolepis weldensis]
MHLYSRDEKTEFTVLEIEMNNLLHTQDCVAPMHTPNKEHIRHILLLEFHKKYDKLSSSKDGFHPEGRTKSRMLKKLNSEQLQVAIDKNPTCTARKLSKTFYVSHVTTYREMKGLKGKVSKAPLPHELSEINKQQRVTCCFTAL